MNSRHRYRFARWMARACLASAAGLLSGIALAQTPTLVISSASVFEGNAGTRVLSLPVNFIGTNSGAVTGLVSAAPLSGAGFNPATGAAACGAPGVDFEQFSNVPFTIPPNTPNGTLTVGIRVCSNTVIEPDEHIFVNFTNVVGALCTSESCAAIGIIRNDDGTPTMTINNISTSEPVIGTKSTSFTVSLSHPTSQEVRVNFATRNGTARAACAGCSPPVVIPDYNPKSGTLVIPADTLTGAISVTILGGASNEPDETFFVDLSVAENATLIAGFSTGRATIRDTTLGIGGFDLSPDGARVKAGETLQYHVDWVVPAHLVWRNLKSIDLRLRGGGKTALWIRWDEASNKFSLCRKNGGGQGGRDDDDDDEDSDRADQRPHAAPVCAPGELPASPAVLATRYARVHMIDTAVVGSGPAGPLVTLKLSLSLTEKSAGRHYRVELAAADDFGNVDSFVHAGDLRVDDRHGHRP